MFPSQPTWSTSRSNLLQRCPRAFVLRYGLAQLSRHHERGRILSIAFQIQTPWILMHQTIREVFLDYLEDYGEWNRLVEWTHKVTIQAGLPKSNTEQESAH